MPRAPRQQRLLCQPPPAPKTQAVLFDAAPAPFARGYARRSRLFQAAPDAAEAAAVVRGAIADALDKSFVDGPLGLVLWQGDRADPAAAAFVEKVIDLAEERDRLGVWKAFQKYGLSVFQAVAVAVAPELYADDPQAAGVVPSNPERVGAARLAAFAKLLGGR